MIGKKITNPKVFLKQKSVWVSNWKKCVPVAFLINMQFKIISNLLTNGYIYKYIKKE